MSPAVVQGVIWRNGAMTVLPDIGGDNYTIPQSVSGDGGIVIGFSENAGGDFRAFRYHHGVSLDLGTLGGPKAQATGISTDGSTITGTASINGTTSKAFRYYAGVMSDLGTLGGSQSSGSAVSGNGGVIVGSFDLAGNAVTHAFSLDASHRDAGSQHFARSGGRCPRFAT